MGGAGGVRDSPLAHDLAGVAGFPQELRQQELRVRDAAHHLLGRVGWRGRAACEQGVPGSRPTLMHLPSGLSGPTDRGTAGSRQAHLAPPRICPGTPSTMAREGWRQLPQPPPRQGLRAASHSSALPAGNPLPLPADCTPVLRILPLLQGPLKSHLVCEPSWRTHPSSQVVSRTFPPAVTWGPGLPGLCGCRACCLSGAGAPEGGACTLCSRAAPQGAGRGGRRGAAGSAVSWWAQHRGAGLARQGLCKALCWRPGATLPGHCVLWVFQNLS